MKGPQENHCLVIHCPHEGQLMLLLCLFLTSTQSRPPSRISRVTEKNQAPFSLSEVAWGRFLPLPVIWRLGPKSRTAWTDGLATGRGMRDNKMLPLCLTPDSNCSDHSLMRGKSIRSYKTTSRLHAAPETTVYTEELQDVTWQMMPSEIYLWQLSETTKHTVNHLLPLFLVTYIYKVSSKTTYFILIMLSLNLGNDCLLAHKSQSRRSDVLIWAVDCSLSFQSVDCMYTGHFHGCELYFLCGHTQGKKPLLTCISSTASSPANHSSAPVLSEKPKGVVLE